MFIDLTSNQHHTNTIKFDQSDDSRDPPSNINKNLLSNMDASTMDPPTNLDAAPKQNTSQDNKVDLDDLYMKVKQEDNTQVAANKLNNSMQVTPIRRPLKASRPSNSKGTPRPSNTQPRLKIDSVKRYFTSSSNSSNTHKKSRN